MKTFDKNKLIARLPFATHAKATKPKTERTSANFMSSFPQECARGSAFNFLF